MNSEPTVFVVDDDPAARALVASLLQVIFPRVRSFASACEFLQQYDPSCPGCLVLDVAMPGMSGLELYRHMRESDILLPVVFLTGHGNVRMAVEAMRDGAVNFLEKPFKEQDLWDSVRGAMDRDGVDRRKKIEQDELERHMATLSRGEHDVLGLILAGKYNKQIAAQLKLSIRTIEDRRARLMKKLHVGSVVELVQLAMAWRPPAEQPPGKTLPAGQPSVPAAATGG